MINVTWRRCKDEQWCSLLSVNLDHQAFDTGGVYIIWHGGPNAHTAYVGQGDPVRDRLRAHRSDLKILAYKARGLYVTWATVPSGQRGGVERYLTDKLSPLVGGAWPHVTPFAVNLPW